MRVWNLTSASARKEAFEPTAAEIFGVQGKTSIRFFTAIAPPEDYGGRACELCDFRPNASEGKPLCAFGRFLCSPNDRKDNRQIIAAKREKP